MEVILQGVSHFYKKECVLQDLSYTFSAGEITTILGKSGSGKSTLLNIISGLEAYTQGKIFFNGNQQIHFPIGYMTQNDLLLPFKTVLGNLMIVCRLQKKNKKDSLIQVKALLSQFRLESIACKYPRELSGGMRQRVSLLRQFLIDSPLLLLDEPFGALDILTKESIQRELLSYMKDKRKTVILVTHDIKEAFFLSEHILILGGAPSRGVGSFSVEEGSWAPHKKKIIELLKENY